MCGRYATSRSPEDLVEEFRIELTLGPGPGGEPTGTGVDFNVAPTDSALVVLERRPRREDGEAMPAADDSVGVDGDAEPGSASHAIPDAGPNSTEAEPQAPRWLRRLNWGLVPSWSADRRGAARMINARSETLLDKGFRKAALTRRCLVPADGWYEWQVSPSATDSRGKPRKQPFFMHLATGEGLAFAGIYEFWRDDAVHPDDPGAWLTTFAVITTAAEEGLDRIHDRMPLVLPPHDWDDWLDPQLRDGDAVRAMLVPPPAGRFATRPVGVMVNSVANDGPDLVAPLPLDQLRGVVDPVTGELIGDGADSLF